MLNCITLHYIVLSCTIYLCSILLYCAKKYNNKLNSYKIRLVCAVFAMQEFIKFCIQKFIDVRSQTHLPKITLKAKSESMLALGPMLNRICLMSKK